MKKLTKKSNLSFVVPGFVIVLSIVVYKHVPFRMLFENSLTNTADSWQFVNENYKSELKFEETYATECTIVDRRASAFSIEDFDNDFYGKKPVIFRNSNCAVLEKMHREVLLAKYGNVSIGIASNSDGTFPLGGRTLLKTTLSEFVSAISVWPPKNIYFFDSVEGDFLAAAHAQIGHTPLDDYIPPPHFDDKKQFERTHARMTIGGAGSGLAFHQHFGTYNELFVGGKRWSLYGPGNAPVKQGYSVYKSQLSWLHETNRIEQRDAPPLECVQYPGDVIYIPDGWLHATLNLRRTIGIARNAAKSLPHTGVHFQSKAMALAMDEERTVKATNRELQRAEKFMRRAIALDPTNAHHYGQLSVVLSKQGKHTAQYQAISKGLSVNKQSTSLRYRQVLALLNMYNINIGNDGYVDFLGKSYEAIVAQHEQGGLREDLRQYNFPLFLQAIEQKLDQEEHGVNHILEDGSRLTSEMVRELLMMSGGV